jgi:hypothetical protein
MSFYQTSVVSSLLKERMITTHLNGKRGTVMTEVTEFESRTHWDRNRLHTQKNGSYHKQSVANVESFLAHERWASLRTDGPGILPIPEEAQPISFDNRLLAEMDRWDLVYGLQETPNRKGHVVNVETPSDHWSWCGDPALGLRICLKKRMSILSHFGG